MMMQIKFLKDGWKVTFWDKGTRKHYNELDLASKKMVVDAIPEVMSNLSKQ